MDVGGIVAISIISALVSGLIMGLISQTINQNKGYTGGFAWGFWLGILGIIVVACKSPAWQRPVTYNTAPVQKPEKDVWFCTNCGMRHEAYEHICSCGQQKLKVETTANVAEQNNGPQPVKNQDDEKTIRALKEYKELIDAGIITAEEFEAKKKSLLN